MIPSFDISVVIPLYQAANYLPDLLAHLEKQTFALDRFEVILVDDVSPDQTVALAEQLQVTSPLHLQLLRRTENGGVSATRNTGWKMAHAPLVLFVDQDCLPHPDLLTSHYQMHLDQQRLALVGRIEWSKQFQENPASEHYKSGYFPSWDTYQPDGLNWHLFVTSNASISRAALEQIGGFNPDFRHNFEDFVVGYRLERAGYKIKLCPAALVYHNRPLPVAEIFRRNFVAGREMVRFIHEYPELLGHPILLNPAQALDWGYRLANIEGLLAETLDRLNPTEIAAFAPLLSHASDYLLNNPIWWRIDRPYFQVWQAQHNYLRQQQQVYWLEAVHQGLGDRGQGMGDRRGLGVRGWGARLRKWLSGKSRARVAQIADSNKQSAISSQQPLAITTSQPSTPKPQPLLSVLTRLTPDIGREEWARFLGGMAAQTEPNFELLVVLDRPDQPAWLVVFPATMKMRQVPEVSAALAAAIGDWLVCLAADSLPVPDLLAVYREQCKSGLVLQGLELPLSADTLLVTSSVIAAKLHFSACSLRNLALPREYADQIFDERFSGRMADLVAGWRLRQAGLTLQECPLATSYVSPVRRLAQRLRDYLALAPQLTALQDSYPALALLYNRTRRPADLTSAAFPLFYDTLINYPLSQGLAVGLDQFFDLQSYLALANHPLFGADFTHWEQERLAYLTAQLARLHAGQNELDTYASHLATVLEHSEFEK